jgi:hypothetical protein
VLTRRCRRCCPQMSLAQRAAAPRGARGGAAAPAAALRCRDIRQAADAAPPCLRSRAAAPPAPAAALAAPPAAGRRRRAAAPLVRLSAPARSQP